MRLGADFSTQVIASIKAGASLSMLNTLVKEFVSRLNVLKDTQNPASMAKSVQEKICVPINTQKKTQRLNELTKGTSSIANRKIIISY